MPLYTLSELPIPIGYVDATPVKINFHGQIAGTCVTYYGSTRAMIWNSAGYTVINAPALNSYATGINSNQVLVGNYVDAMVNTNPYYWDAAIGVLTLLPIPPQNGTGAGAIVNGINDNNQMVGYLMRPTAGPETSCIFWNGLNSNPVVFGNPNAISSGTGINNNGILIGTTFITPDFQGFCGDAALQNLTLIPDSRNCYAINDLASPQILTSNTMNTFHTYMYDTFTNTLNELSTPGDYAFGVDINNFGEIVGENNTDGAILWSGLLKVNLNDPLITDAKIKGWNLTRALSINDKGQIVGKGIFGGKESPFLLNPKIAIHIIRAEYMLPHFVWPGEQYDGPRPKGWPEEFPFPLPEPSPFELIGEAYKIQQEILYALKIEGMINNMPNEQEGVAMKKIITKMIGEKSQNLKDLFQKRTMDKSS